MQNVTLKRLGARRVTFAVACTLNVTRERVDRSRVTLSSSPGGRRAKGDRTVPRRRGAA